MLREMHLSRKESKREIQDVVEHSYRRRSLSGRRSNSDYKTGKESENTSNFGKESHSDEQGSSSSKKNTKISEKPSIQSDEGTKGVELEKNKTDIVHSSTPERDLIFTLSGKDVTDSDKETQPGIASYTNDGQSAEDGKESLRGTP